MKDPDEFENKAFAKLGDLLGIEPSSTPPSEASERKTETASPKSGGESSPLASSEPVVRRERKQRRGKTVTRVSRLGLNAAALQPLARELAKALGCGAKVEEDDVVLQGDQIERAAKWLERKGARRVVRGN